MLFQLAGGPQASSIVDDLPLQWSDYGQNNTIILVNLPRGDHQMLNELVDPEGSVPTSQVCRSNRRAIMLVRDT